jgi:hypothetical protein
MYFAPNEQQGHRNRRCSRSERVARAKGKAAYTSNGTVDIMILKCTVMRVLVSTITVQFTMLVFSPPDWERARDIVKPKEAVRILKRV